MFAKLKDLKHCIFYTAYNGSMVYNICAVAFVSIEVRHVHNSNEKNVFLLQYKYSSMRKIHASFEYCLFYNQFNNKNHSWTCSTLILSV